jgi:hypothetical protein
LAFGEAENEAWHDAKPAKEFDTSLAISQLVTTFVGLTHI